MEHTYALLFGLALVALGVAILFSDSFFSWRKRTTSHPKAHEDGRRWGGISAIVMGVFIIVASVIEWSNSFALLLEIGGQLLALALAMWFIRSAYLENRKAKHYSIRSYFRRFTQPFTKTDFDTSMNEYWTAMGFVSGAVIIIFMVLKLITCGFVCGPEWW